MKKLNILANPAVILRSALCAAAFGAPAFAETISSDTQMPSDYAYTGSLTVNQGVTLDLNGFDLGNPADTAQALTSLGGTGTITNTSGERSLITLTHTSQFNPLTPTLTGNLSVAFNSNDVIVRLANTANDWTGDTYINGSRLHVTSQDCIGSGTIYLNGNLVNNNSGGAHLALNNAIVLTGTNASIRAAYSGSITVSGVISQDANAENVRFCIGAKESASNTYNIYGANTYTAPTYIGDSGFSTQTHKITIAESSAFGTGEIYMVSHANLNLGKSGQEYSSFKLGNALHLADRTLSIVNNTKSAFTFSSAVDSKNTAGTVLSGGTLKINGNGAEFTLDGTYTGNMTLDLQNKDSKTGYIKASFNGDIDTIYRSEGVVYYRHNIRDQQNTGDTWVYGGNNTRLHVSYGSGLGSGKIYLDGNLCNNSQSARRVTFDQDIVINGNSASFRVAYKNDDNGASMRLNGVISSDPAKDGSQRITFNANEGAPGMIFVYGENTFTCDSYTNSGCTTDLTLGTDTALGNPDESVFRPAGHVRVSLETNTADTVRTLANDIVIANGKTIRFRNYSTKWASDAEDSAWSQAGGLGSVLISSNITGGATSDVVFGSAAEAENTGSMTYSGTLGTADVPLASSIAAGLDFTSDHARFYGNLTSNASASLTVDGGMSVFGNLTLPSTVTLNIDDLENNFTLLDVDGTLTFQDSFSLELTSDAAALDPLNQILVLSADSMQDVSGNELSYSDVLDKMTFSELVFPESAGWNYVLSVDASGIWLKADPNAVPEPSAFVLLAAGIGGLCWMRRNQNLKRKQA